eukprot:706730_1
MGCCCCSEDTDVELVQVSDLENQIANSSGSSSLPGNGEDNHGFATNLKNFFSPKLFTSSYWEGNFKFAVAILVILLCFFGPLPGMYIYRKLQNTPITYTEIDHEIIDVSSSGSLDSNLVPQNIIYGISDSDSFDIDQKPEEFPSQETSTKTNIIDDSKSNEVPQSPASPIDPSQTNEENKESNQDIVLQPVQDANEIHQSPASATIPIENKEENKDNGVQHVQDADVLNPDQPNQRYGGFVKFDSDSSWHPGSSSDSDSDANDESKEKHVVPPYLPPGGGKNELTVQNVNLMCSRHDLHSKLKGLNLALESDPSKVKWATSSSWTKRKERKRVNKKSLRLVITVSDSDKFHFEGDWRLHALCAPDDKLNKRVWKFSIVNGGKVTEFSGLHGKVVAHEKRSENHDSNDD